MSAPSPRRDGGFSWPLAFTLIALIIAAIIALIFLRLESWPARTAKQGTAELERLGRQLRDAFVEIGNLQPRITINNRVYLEQSTPVAELVILSRRIEAEREFLHTWAGSTKRVKLHGTYTAKAGFDLRQNFVVDVGEKEITVQLPHAVILGIEQEQVDVLAFENGLWNKISTADLQNELAALPQLARDKAIQSGLAAEAEVSLQKQIDERINLGRPVGVRFTNGQPKG